MQHREGREGLKGCGNSARHGLPDNSSRVRTDLVMASYFMSLMETSLWMRVTPIQWSASGISACVLTQ